MIEFINLYLVPALAIGSVYALGAVGISMIFGILRFAHFAHGDLMTLGAYGVLTMVWLLPFHPLLMLPAGMILAVIAALLVDRFFYQPLHCGIHCLGKSLYRLLKLLCLNQVLEGYRTIGSEKCRLPNENGFAGFIQ